MPHYYDAHLSNECVMIYIRKVDCLSGIIGFLGGCADWQCVVNLPLTLQIGCDGYFQYIHILTLFATS